MGSHDESRTAASHAGARRPGNPAATRRRRPMRLRKPARAAARPSRVRRSDLAAAVRIARACTRVLNEKACVSRNS